MKRHIPLLLALAFCIASIIPLTGCQEQNTAGGKKSRLIADQNRQLKAQLKQCGTEIDKQKELLATCQKINKDLYEKSAEKSRKMIENLVTAISKQNQQLKAENQRLKAQIEELRK